MTKARLQTMDLYQRGLRPLLFSVLKADPEGIQQQLLRYLAWCDRHCDRPEVIWWQRQCHRAWGLDYPCLHQTLWGLNFPNPIGLAAGFDKNGVATNLWPSLGFGFTEVGTVTFQAQPGNPRPRLFRLPLDHAAINRMGFNNQGAAQMAAVLAASQQRCSPVAERSAKPPAAPLGINLGKSKITPLDEAVADYVGSFRLLKDYGDYFVVNVSSPNTPGLRNLQAKDQLAPILDGLQTENQGSKPLLVKIAPDLDWEEIRDILDLAQIYQLAGIIATNTTLNKQNLRTQRIAATGRLPVEEAGGLSGAPLRQRSTEIIRFIWQQTQGQLPIIGVGGIFTAEDAWEKLAAGASLLQVYTGWVYEGPGMIRRLLEGVLQKLAQQNQTQLNEIVGQAHCL